MTAYELMIKTNHRLIMGEAMSGEDRRGVVEQLLAARCQPGQAARFYNGVRYPGNIDKQGRRMYPFYYLPPYNDGKKLKTLMCVTPKTHILSANAYELEILRLLRVLSPENADVKEMAALTLDRLKTTCFGNGDDGLGECFDASLIVLRFLAAAAPGETQWMKERMGNFHRHFDEKHRHWGVKWYYWLCLSELPFGVSEPEIRLFKEDILTLLNRSYVMNSEADRATHPMIVCVIRNVMARLPEYAYISERLPYLCKKDNRLHFDMNM